MSDVERRNREQEDERSRALEAGRPEREAERQRQLDAVEYQHRGRVAELQPMGRETPEKWGDLPSARPSSASIIDAPDQLLAAGVTV